MFKAKEIELSFLSLHFFTIVLRTLFSTQKLFFSLHFFFFYNMQSQDSAFIYLCPSSLSPIVACCIHTTADWNCGSSFLLTHLSSIKSCSLNTMKKWVLNKQLACESDIVTVFPNYHQFSREQILSGCSKTSVLFLTFVWVCFWPEQLCSWCNIINVLLYRL